MNPDLEHRLQAWVDGELDAATAREVEAWVARDAEARALSENLRSFSRLVREHEPVRSVPEAPDFFWSQIRRGIEQSDREAARVAQPAARGLGSWLAWLVPAGAVAAAVLLLTRPSSEEKPLASDLASGAVSTPVVGHEIESPPADMETVTFYSSQESMTVIWLAHADVL